MRRGACVAKSDVIPTGDGASLSAAQIGPGLARSTSTPFAPTTFDCSRWRAPLKILHILDHSIPLQSGYSFRTRAILREQRARGWDTAHVTGPRQGATKAPVERVDGLDFYRTPLPGTVWSRLPAGAAGATVLALRRRLDSVIAQERPDLLQAHSPALSGLAALGAARAHRLPCVYEVRAFWEDAAVDHGTSREGGLRYRLTRALETFVLRRVDAVTTICGGLRQDMLARGIPAERITVIPNAVDLAEFHDDTPVDEALRVELGLAGRIVVGFVGSFYAYEGLRLLVEALPALRRRVPEVTLLLVGGGPQEAELRALAPALGLGSDVVFTGRVPHSEVQRYYALIDVLAYPRLPMRLTELVTPLKPLEAMAQRRLFVASDVGGHRELVRHGETGILFPAGDASALAGALGDLLLQPDSWDRLRAAGRRFVERERTWRDSVARYDSVYDALLDRGGAVPAAQRAREKQTS